jgi:hypothetical protein
VVGDGGGGEGDGDMVLEDGDGGGVGAFDAIVGEEDIRVGEVEGVIVGDGDGVLLIAKEGDPIV